MKLVFTGHYYWHLNRTPSHPLPLDDISISFVEVKDTLSEEPPRFIALDESDNLCDELRWIDVPVDDPISDGPMYGFKLVNTTGKTEHLFLVLLYFDNVEFTIYPVFKHAVGPNASAPWSGPSMSIGYGCGAGAAVLPFYFVMMDGPHQVEAGSFKFFLSNKPIDLDCAIQEASPFRSLRTMQPKAVVPSAHRFQQQWAEMTFPVVTRRRWGE